MAAVFAGGLYFMQGYGHPNGKSDRSRVVVSVIFSPEIRDFNIWIQVSVAGVKMVEDRTKHSPWERVLEVAPGSSVRLVATQYRTGTMECGILPPSGRLVARRIDFPGEITCVTVA